MDKVKLLIIEADPLLGGALKGLLERTGYRPSLAASGTEALEAAAEESFDLVLLDIWLPDADGLDILRKITDCRPYCGSIVMTGYYSIDVAVKAMKLGAFDFLTKPFPMEMLFLKIESFLASRGTGKPIGAHPEKMSPVSGITSRCPAIMAALEALSGEAPPPTPAAIPGTLPACGLFGVENGATTGAGQAIPPDPRAPGPIENISKAFAVGKPLKVAVIEFERKYIERAIQYTGGHRSSAAKLLEISRKVMWEKLKR